MVLSPYSKETKIEVKRELFHANRAFSNAHFEQRFKRRYAACMTVSETSRSCSVPQSLNRDDSERIQGPCNSREVLRGSLCGNRKAGTSWNLRELPTCVTCDIVTWSRLREIKHACLYWLKHIYKTSAWTFSSGLLSQTCCTPFEVSLNTKSSLFWINASASECKVCLHWSFALGRSSAEALSVDMVASNCSQASSHVDDAVQVLGSFGQLKCWWSGFPDNTKPSASKFCSFNNHKMARAQKCPMWKLHTPSAPESINGSHWSMKLCFVSSTCFPGKCLLIWIYGWVTLMLNASPRHQCGYYSARNRPTTPRFHCIPCTNTFQGIFVSCKHTHTFCYFGLSYCLILLDAVSVDGLGGTSTNLIS